LLATQGNDLGEGRLQNAEELIDDLGLPPEEALQVLHPLEIRDYDAAGVAEHVRDKEDFRPLIEDYVRLGVGGAVGGLGEDAALDLAGVGGGDLALQGGGDDDI